MAEYKRYQKLERYVNGQPTGEYRQGDLIDVKDYESQEDCEHNAQYRWADSGATICDGYALHKQEILQKSYDQGETWTDVSPRQTRLGEMLDQFSSECGATVLYSWRVYDTYCDGMIEYQRSYKIMSLDMGQTWTDVIPRVYKTEPVNYSQECMAETDPFTYEVTTTNTVYPTITVDTSFLSQYPLVIDWGDGQVTEYDFTIPEQVTETRVVDGVEVERLINYRKPKNQNMNCSVKYPYDFIESVFDRYSPYGTGDNDYYAWHTPYPHSGDADIQVLCFQIGRTFYTSGGFSYSELPGGDSSLFGSNIYYRTPEGSYYHFMEGPSRWHNWNPCEGGTPENPSWSEPPDDALVSRVALPNPIEQEEASLTIRDSTYTGSPSHTYMIPGTYTIKIWGLPKIIRGLSGDIDTFSITDWGYFVNKVLINLTIPLWKPSLTAFGDEFDAWLDRQVELGTMTEVWANTHKRDNKQPDEVSCCRQRYPIDRYGGGASDYIEYFYGGSNYIPVPERVYREQKMSIINNTQYPIEVNLANYEKLVGITDTNSEALKNIIKFDCQNTGIVALPSQLFRYTTSVAEVYFQNNTDIVGGIPSGFFDYATNLALSNFSGSSITSIPDRLYANTSQLKYDSTFKDCTSLTSIGTECLGTTNTNLNPVVLTTRTESQYDGEPMIRYTQNGSPRPTALDGVNCYENQHAAGLIDFPYGGENYFIGYDGDTTYAEPYNTVMPSHARALGGSWAHHWEAGGGNNTYIRTIYLTQNDLFSICVDTFKGCTALTSISNNIFLTGVGTTNGMFEGCTSLVSVPQSWVQKFTGYNTQEPNFSFTSTQGTVNSPLYTAKAFSAISMFRGCTSLTTVLNLDNLPTSLKYIDLNSMYIGCHSITQVNWSNSTLGSKMYFMYYTFAGCSGLQSVNIAFTINNAQHSFALCNNLTSATIYANKASWTFYRCPNLTTIGGQINIVADHTYAFSGVTSCPNGLITDCIFTRCTFAYCDSLTSIQGTKIGKYPFLTFMNCKNLDASNYASMYQLYPYTSSTQVIEPGYRWTMAFAGCNNTQNLLAKWGGPCIYDEQLRTVQCRSVPELEPSGEGEVFSKAELFELVGYVDQYKIIILEDYFTDNYAYASYIYGINNLYCIVSGLETDIQRDYLTSTQWDSEQEKPKSIGVLGLPNRGTDPYSIYYWYTDTPSGMVQVSAYNYTNSNIKYSTVFHWNAQAIQDKSKYSTLNIAMPKVLWRDFIINTNVRNESSSFTLNYFELLSEDYTTLMTNLLPVTNKSYLFQNLPPKFPTDASYYAGTTDARYMFSYKYWEYNQIPKLWEVTTISTANLENAFYRCKVSQATYDQIHADAYALRGPAIYNWNWSRFMGFIVQS